MSPGKTSGAIRMKNKHKKRFPENREFQGSNSAQTAFSENFEKADGLEGVTLWRQRLKLERESGSELIGHGR